MPLVFIGVPPENRSALIDSLRKLDPDGVEIVESAVEPGDLALRVDDMEEPFRTVERVGQILIAANEVAGRQLEAIATAESGWGNPPTVI